jgi:DNA repair protein RadA/Sms
MVVFGEIGLSGEVRSVSQADLRLKEAAKLGFGRALVPPSRRRREGPGAALRTVEIAHLQDIVDVVGPGARLSTARRERMPG